MSLKGEQDAATSDPRQQQAQDAAAEDDPLAPPPPPPNNNSNNNNNNGQALSSWALEGVRRVRSDQVQRKMHWLTGTAAIGGFLFRYDT